MLLFLAMQNTKDTENNNFEPDKYSPMGIMIPTLLSVGSVAKIKTMDNGECQKMSRINCVYLSKIELDFLLDLMYMKGKFVN